MGKYDDAIGGGKIILDVEEVLNEESAKKVDDRIKRQKADLERPIEVNVKTDKAEKRMDALAKAAKQVKHDLQEALSSQKSFDEINKLVSKYELLKKQIKAVTPEINKNNSSLKEGNKVLKDTKKLVEQLTVSQDKLSRTRKTRTNTSTKKEADATKELAVATEQVIQAQEKSQNTTLRIQAQVNAELNKELQKLKEIEAQQTKNEAARERFRKEKANYGKEFLGTDKAVYDTDLLKGASAELKEFNNLLNTRNKYQEKYNKLCRMVEKYYVSDYGISNGVYKNLDQFVEMNASMKRLDAMFEQGQKTTNKEINALFNDVVRELKSEGSMVANLISSGDAIGDLVGQALDKRESELNKEMQRLHEERQVQLTKINTLRQEELDLIKKAGQAETNNSKKLKFADGTLLNETQIKAVEKYCAVLKKSMGEAYNEARELRTALDLVFDIKEGNVANLMDRFTAGNKASNAALQIMTGMTVNNQTNRDAALRSINPDIYDKIVADQKASAEQAKLELKSQKSDFEKQWDDFASAMLGENAFKDESNLVKGKILKAFGSYGKTAKEAIEEINKAWLKGELDGKSFKSKWVGRYVAHLDNLKEYYAEMKNAKAGDFDAEAWLGGKTILDGSATFTEEKAQALKNEAAAWDELIAKKKAYYGIEENVKDTVKQLEKARLKLTPKKEGNYTVPETYTALDGKYEVSKGQDGWNVYQFDNAGLYNLIGTYKTLQEVREDASLLAREEIVLTDEVVREIKILQETYSALDNKIKGHVPVINKYQDVLALVKTGALSAADAVKQLNEFISNKGLATTTDSNVQQSNKVETVTQLVDNYGHALDEVNNKLMQGVKLLNEQAQVLRLFHNSPNIFDTFDATKGKPNQGQSLGRGNYLALKQGGEFNEPTYGRYQTQWYANVQNPFNVGDRLTDSQSASIIDKFMADRAESFKQHMLSKLTENDVVTAIKDIADIAKTTVGEIFTSIGYDSIKDSEQINVFDSSKIYRANDSVLDIGATEFESLRELQKKIWEERSIISKANDQIKALSNEYSGKTESELDFALFSEALTKGWGWQNNVAKIASAFKELTGELPKSDQISEDSLRALVENYEFSKQGLQEYQDAVTKHETILNELQTKFDAQKAVTDNITQSYLAGNISGVINPERTTQLPSADGVVSESKKLKSSYGGLAEAVEKYAISSKQLWEAYDKHQDFDKFAEDRNAAIKQIASMFPDGRIAGGTSVETYLQDQGTSRMYASNGAESALVDIEKQLTQSKAEQARLAQESEVKALAQAEAEKKVAEEALKAAEAKEKQAVSSVKAADVAKTISSSEVSVEELISRDINEALAQLRSAKDNETSLISLKGVFSGDDLVDQFRNMVEQIAAQANLSVGNINVKDDVAKVRLYNDELKVTVDQTYQLKQATEEAEASLQLVSQSFNQNVKALNENNFDVEGVQQRALAAVEKVRSSLHGLEYDLTDLSNAAKNISSQDDFVKFGNQLKAAQDSIQAIKNSTVSKNSMNPLANMQRDMQNASIEIETMRLKLEKFGDIQGVTEAKKMLTEMAEAAKQYNAATDAQGQQSAYNQYSNLRSSFKAQTDYINAAKSLNDSQESTQKQTDPIKHQYQTILDLVNKINTANERMIKFQSMDGGSGVLGDQIQGEIDKKLEAVEKLKTVMSELNVGNVLGQDNYSIPGDIKSIGTDYSQIASFINDAGVQASLTTAEIEKLVKALVKAGDIDLSMLDEMLNSGSLKERAKQVAYENRYFSDKTRVSLDSDGNANINVDEIQRLGNAGSGAKDKLEELAQAIAKNSEGAVALTKNFSMGADGIAKLDFSILDTTTGTIKDFTAALGTATGQYAVFDTTVDKSVKNMQAARKQMSAAQDVIGKLGFSDANVDASTPKLVTDTLGKIRQLSKEIAKKDGDDQNKITEYTKDLKEMIKALEQADNRARKMESAIENDAATYIGTIDPKGDVYRQLYSQVQKYASTQGDVTFEIGNFNKATNTLDYSLISANGSVQKMQMSMYGLKGEVASQQVGVGKLTNSWDVFKSSIGSAGKKLMTALVGYNAFFKVISEVRKGIGYVKEIDLALTELKKVTDETEESYKKFLNTAAGTAGKIGSTLSDYTEATANFARLGYTMEESAQMAETAIVYKNVADGLDTVEESTDSIISTMKAFGIESNDTMGIIDRFNEVGNNFAITSAGIGEALQRSASALYAGGNTIDESIALVTAANSVIQNPEQVGTALKTLSLRIRGVKTELEEAGLETEGMAETTSQLQAKLKALTHGKVDIMLNADTFKNTTQILREMSSAWSEMTDIEQAECCLNVQKCA